MNILFLCSYGQVRSIALRKAFIKKYGNTHNSEARGLFNTRITQWKQDILKYDKIMVCNKSAFENIHNYLYFDNAQQELYNLFMEEHTNKVVIVDILRKDVWGKSEHPELI